MLTAARRTAAFGGRPRWWTELPLIALVYVIYSAGRLVARGDAHTADGHGLAILRLEELLRIAPERALNRVFTDTPALGIPADFVYASLHYLLTPLILVWLWRRHSGRYRIMRTWLMISTLIGLVGFTLLPTAPPRLLPSGHGFTDTMAHFSSYGWWGEDASAPRGLGKLTNEYAAMPSLHVGWALWCGVALWVFGTTKAAKAAAVAYPLLVALVVMGTANHYLLDALAGAAVMGVGLLLTRPALRLTEGVRGRFGAGRGAPVGEGAVAGGGAVVGNGAVAGGGVVAGAVSRDGAVFGDGPVAGAVGPAVAVAHVAADRVSGVPGRVPHPRIAAVGGSMAPPVTGPAHRPDAGVGRPVTADVSAGCQTSARERFPRESSRGGAPVGRAASAGDGPASAAH
ncbi:phosphatase PAP2 family protein [Streptomyces sp. NPDC003077]|uniref:phosphatase PAP2 family protein n=1 Tax=Streptomyces sp. NPDC003077 TaxID=3154443 RepID=UPI00339ED2D5